MAKHHELAGILAVHRFAFVQGTDPALVAGNHVGAGKAWIDTASGNALKVRNEANSAWINVVAGASSVSAVWRSLIYVDIEAALPGTSTPTPFVLLTYVP